MKDELVLACEVDWYFGTSIAKIGGPAKKKPKKSECKFLSGLWLTPGVCKCRMKCQEVWKGRFPRRLRSKETFQRREMLECKPNLSGEISERVH